VGFSFTVDLLLEILAHCGRRKSSSLYTIFLNIKEKLLEILAHRGRRKSSSLYIIFLNIKEKQTVTKTCTPMRVCIKVFSLNFVDTDVYIYTYLVIDTTKSKKNEQLF
jgi:hypothetical protein